MPNNALPQRDQKIIREPTYNQEESDITKHTLCTSTTPPRDAPDIIRPGELYSSSNADEKQLRVAINKSTGLDCAIRWQLINTGSNGKLSPDQMIKALHFEVDAKHVHGDTATLK
jgi:hypothetical protein